METGSLERYLHMHIPLSEAMGVTVLAASADGVTLAAPLGPNINHRHILFGGSASAVVILAAWTLVHVRLQAIGIKGRIVIHSNRMRYDRPVDGDFVARAYPPDDAVWRRAIATLKRRRMARLIVHAELESAGVLACGFEGEFAILPDAS